PTRRSSDLFVFRPKGNFIEQRSSVRGQDSHACLGPATADARRVDGAPCGRMTPAGGTDMGGARDKAIWDTPQHGAAGSVRGCAGDGAEVSAGPLTCIREPRWRSSGPASYEAEGDQPALLRCGRRVLSRPSPWSWDGARRRGQVVESGFSTWFSSPIAPTGLADGFGL